MEKIEDHGITFKTLIGCKRTTALLICTILLFSFLASLLSSNFGKVKIEEVTIDQRGASLDGLMYYPAGTSDADRLPAVVVVHGANSSKLAVRSWSEEIARRGYVVVALDAYGNGLSEQPPADENGGGEENYSNLNTPAGILDMVDYLRGVSFVDNTKIAIVGHSLGSRRCDAAAYMDCGYLTLNDQLINILCERFSLSFQPEEIYQDATSLAKEKLSQESFIRYEILKAEIEENFNSRINTVIMVGGKAIKTTPKQTVTVAGYEVQRSLQANVAIINGRYDTTYTNYNTYPETREAWYTGEEDVIPETWYILDDETQTSTTHGTLFDASLTDDAALERGFANRDVWLYSKAGEETHSANLLSTVTTSAILQVLAQSFNYNNGSLDTAVPINVHDLHYWYREICNLIAMLAMFLLPISVGGLLLNTEFFSCCRKKKESIILCGNDFNKPMYYIVSAICAVLSFLGVMYVNVNGEAIMKCSDFFPLARGQGNTFTWLLICDLIAVLSIIITCIHRKKETGHCGITALFTNKVSVILKTILLGLILFLVNYGMSAVIKYLFNQYFAFWIYPFAEMKMEYWPIFLRYFIVLFPIMFILGLNVNLSVRTDISEAKDTAMTVFLNSIGIWACCLVNFIGFKFFFNGTLFSSFQNSYPMLFTIPLMTYMHRKLYKSTGSIWLGTAVITALLVWQMASTFGVEHWYIGQSLLSIIGGL